MGEWNNKKSKSAEITDRRRVVAANLKAGATYMDIAGALSVSVGTIANDVKELMKQWNESTTTDIEQYVSLELRRLDDATNSIWDKVRDGELPAIDRMLKIMDQRAKYLGLYREERVQHEFVITDATTEISRRLNQLSERRGEVMAIPGHDGAAETGSAA